MPFEKCSNMASATSMSPQNHGVLHLNNLPASLTISAQPGAVAAGANINLVDLGKKLLDASRSGETEEVKSLMQSGAPFTTDWLGTSPLHFAAQFGHHETADVLLRAGISRDARTKVDRTPLHVAAQEGHLAIVSLLIKHGADVDARDMLKMTPLHWALVRGHTDVAECLLANCADVNIKSKFEKTPIDIAYDYGRMDILPTLQKYVGISRPKPEPRQTSTPAVKMRPTVLPNKANRTPKLARNQQLTKQLFLPGGLANWQKAITLENLRKLFSGTDNSINLDDLNSAASNPVLATLAALAAASSSSQSSSSSSSSMPTEAANLLQWLETHGISMNNPNDSNLFQSAIDSGQTISLTEAGKLAMNWVKEQQQQHHEHQQQQHEESQTPQTSSSTSNKNSKVITIVADSTQLPQIISSTQATPIVLVSGSLDADGKTKKSPVKVSKTNLVTSTLKNNTNSNVKHVVISNSTKESLSHILELEKEKERLLAELEASKKQAEEYKTKLLLKEKEAERYKRQLEELRATHN